MSGQVQNLTQGPGGLPKCKGKVCCHGHWADHAKPSLVFFSHGDMVTDVFWIRQTPTPEGGEAPEWFWRSLPHKWWVYEKI